MSFSVFFVVSYSKMIKIFILQLFFLVGFLSGFDPKQHKNWKLLPHGICGQVGSNRIIGGVEAPMNAYPWIVRIGYHYSNFNEIIFLCAGSIANSRTVVTAAHCIPNTTGRYEPKVIRLGEHDIQTNPDCNGNFCADPVLDVAIFEILIPKNYSSKGYKYDIALVRLKKEIKFTAFVKPICFGGAEFLKKDFSGKMAEVAGWGIYNISKPLLSVKLQVVKLSVINYRNCSKYYMSKIRLGPTQLCAGGIIEKDSCGGDSGGPLMIVDDGPDGPRYYLLGIVSFGPAECGKTETPGVYTSMSAYLKWFLDNLEKKNNDSVIVG